ncbi:MAG: hypothetical protein CLLPBCKN_006350 [Chroococcidiopsis cubana SAG 39.79]|uniref:Uncharacterized protein n=1 Tax=Chroococcidiopsis cubana SAG 39.79 TaxID=388085 RepID=A0AB37UAS8_9CYAN|nr:hypothetical protein [Chroococcidiopsis cubana]MDZ4876915.1 hypothetical protein [Chroococcidiopsis cubana SAG 39.79]PSB54789.1 hypothetical protein C7B79_34380 [Chroococcidiopsis cubana CCALA 043]RUT03361.1 hypothetical protein DSM107010_60480 [Chroococcidiopsis cubana SAG 39.79]
MIANRNIDECLLGILDCPSEYSSNNGCHIRWTCGSYYYCTEVTQAWDLPLVRKMSDTFHYWQVFLGRPYDFDREEYSRTYMEIYKTYVEEYRRYMEEYGYAEAWPLLQLLVRKKSGTFHY